jgi:hypothetical protein
MLRLAKGSTLPADYIDAQAAPKGLELFVVSGRLENGDAAHAAGVWLREPRGTGRRFTATADAAVYVKRNHLGG